MADEEMDYEGSDDADIDWRYVDDWIDFDVYDIEEVVADYKERYGKE